MAIVDTLSGNVDTALQPVLGSAAHPASSRSRTPSSRKVSGDR
jgi:hypothetical protein